MFSLKMKRGFLLLNIHEYMVISRSFYIFDLESLYSCCTYICNLSCLIVNRSKDHVLFMIIGIDCPSPAFSYMLCLLVELIWPGVVVWRVADNPSAQQASDRLRFSQRRHVYILPSQFSSGILTCKFIAPSPIDTSTQAHRHNTIASNETPS